MSGEYSSVFVGIKETGVLKKVLRRVAKSCAGIYCEIPTNVKETEEVSVANCYL